MAVVATTSAAVSVELASDSSTEASINPPMDTSSGTGNVESEFANGPMESQSLSQSKRRSYTREKKLFILQYYYKYNCNKYKICQKFGISKPSLIRWIASENEIRKGSKGSKRIKGGGRKPFWPDLEEKLLQEFKEVREKGLKVKHYWFATRAKQLMSELHPSVEFKFSQGWFDCFKFRNKLSFRRRTNVAQKHPSDLEENIRYFHQDIRRVASTGEKVGPLGQFSLSTIANVDQTPLPFTFNGGQGYDQTGAKTVWHRGAASGLEKRQCTAQLAIFADGEPRIKPMLIFRGKGLRISQSEKKQYDH